MLGIATVIVLWLGGRQVLQGRMNIGDFVAFNTYMPHLMWPVLHLGWVITISHRGTASMVRIQEILSQQPEIADEVQIGSSDHRVIGSSKDQTPATRDFAFQSPDDPITRSPDLSGEIEFRNLNFAYNGVSVPKHINLRIPAGSSLAIVRPTGSRNTTPANPLPRIPRILILDDALSSVDTHTEDKILNHLREIMRGRTTIFISHRVSTVRNADCIAVLHQGRIVELGTHDELIARNGYYTDLYNKQLLEEELAEV